MRSFSELVASISWSAAIRARDSSLLRKLHLGNSRSSIEIPLGQGIFADASPREITPNCHALSTSPNTHGMVSHGHKTYFSSWLFLIALTEKQGKGIDCNGSSLPLFSVPSVLRIANDIAKFLESLWNSSESRWACWRSKTFPGILISSRVFRGTPTSRLGFLELEVIRAWWGT